MARFKIPEPDEEASFAELDVIVDELKRYSLVFAICASDEAAATHIARYQSRHPKLKISTVNLLWPESRIYGRLTGVYEAEHPDIMMVTGMAAWTERGDDAKGNEFTVSINLARDGLHDDIHCPVVFWCTPTVYNFIRRNAHDFYSVATTTLRVSLPGDTEADNPSIYGLNAARALSPLERETRIKNLSKAVLDATERLPRQQLDLLKEIGLLQYASGAFASARQSLNLARTIALKLGMIATPDYANILQNLATTDQAAGNYESASELYKQVIDIYSATIGHDHSETATVLHNLASIERSRGNYAQAKTLLEEALTIYEVVIGRYSTEAATTLQDIAAIESASGNNAEARNLYEMSLAYKEAALGRGHPSTATAMHGLATVEQALGNFATARSLYEQVLAIYEATLGWRHPDTATVLHNLAVIAVNTSNLPEGIALAEQARRIYEQSIGNTHPLTRATYKLLSQIYSIQGDHARTLELAEMMDASDSKSLLMAT